MRVKIIRHEHDDDDEKVFEDLVNKSIEELESNGNVKILDVTYNPVPVTGVFFWTAMIKYEEK